MNFTKRNAFVILVLCLFFTASCTTADQPDETSDDHLAPPVSADSAPTLEVGLNQDLMPIGVLAGMNGDASLQIYNTAGQITAEINLSGIGSIDPEHIHLAGNANGDAATIPMVYYGWDPEQALMVSAQNSVRTLRKTSSFLALTGAHGQNAVAFSEVTIENNAPHSYLYTGNLDNLEKAAPFYDLIDEPTQMALSPIGIKAINGTPQGVWYTKTGWGIGGADLIFPITRGLYYYDLISGENKEYIAPERSYQGISPDHSMAGSIAFDFEGDRSMTIIELASKRGINFPLKSSSDRGAGFAVFSPNNQYAAWLEASGSFMDVPSSFHSVIRVGDLASGDVVVEVEDSIVSQNLGGVPVSYIKPAGWLDNQTLLIEARGVDWGDVSLVLLNLENRSLSFFCDGSFAGFAYP